MAAASEPPLRSESAGHRRPVPWSDADFAPLASALQDRGRYGALNPQRLGLLRARLQVRLKALGIPSFSWFHEHDLKARPQGAGAQLLVDLTTINHSSFFREPVPLRALAEHLVARLRSGTLSPVRCWSAGCSNGQEPYSLAMLVAELMGGTLPSQFEIYASDLSLEVVQAAADAVYDARMVAEIPPERLRRFFLRGRGVRQGAYKVVPEIRRAVRFHQFDLRRPDWPIPGGLDAVLCRNVAIYFSEAEQRELLERLGRQVVQGGWVVVGNCEIFADVPGVLRKIAPSIFQRVAG